MPQGATGSSFLPSYTFGNANNAVTNQFYSIPGVSVSYDGNGNLLTDNLNSYTWDPNWGNMLSVNTGAVVVSATYDALGRVVEQGSGTTFTEILYSPLGKAALMNGSTLTKAFVPLPGGETAVYNSTGLAYYRHSDHLGSSRLASTPTRGLYSATAYAPFGEQYKTSGTADPSFTGQNSDTVPSLYDFTFRRLSESQGRWISPDPLGAGAANMGDPQSWNRYAYVENNPLSFVDPLGFERVICFETRFYVDGMYDSSTFDCIDIGGGGGAVDGGGGGGGGGTGGNAPNNGPRPGCVSGALLSNAVSVGIDAVGLIPEAGGVARFIGNQAGYRGVVADQLGAKMIGAFEKSTSTVNGLSSITDTSALGLTSTALTIAGFIPGLGQVSSGLSLGVDLYKTYKAVSACYSHP